MASLWYDHMQVFLYANIDRRTKKKYYKYGDLKIKKKTNDSLNNVVLAQPG